MLFVTSMMVTVAAILSLIWYRDSNRILNTYTRTIAGTLMKDAYNAFSYLLTDTEYLSALIIMNRENVILPLELINDAVPEKHSQFTYAQLVNKKIIDSYIGSMYGHKYYIAGISVVSLNGYLCKTGTALFYPEDIFRMLRIYHMENMDKQIALLPPVKPDGYSGLQRGSYVVPAIRSINSFEGKLLGYVVLYFDYGVIREIFSGNLPEGSIFEVSDRWGNIIFSDRSESSAGVYQYDYIKSSYYAEKAGWKFNMAIPMEAVRLNIMMTMRNTLVILVLVVLAAAGVCAVFVFRITKKFEILSNAMRGLSSGNMEVSSGITGEDEVGRMGHVFDDMVSHIKTLMEEITLAEKRKQKAEIDFLQAQINPHFVSNVLNTIVWMARMGGAENIAGLTGSLISLLHASMKRGSDFISIREELEHIKNYSDIQRICGAYDFDVFVNAGEEVKNLYTLRFILQPLVENAIIHGISGVEGPAPGGETAAPEEGGDGNRIIVTVEREDPGMVPETAPEAAAVRMEVFDNGRGMGTQELEGILGKENEGRGGYSSIGLKNIHDRIRLYFGDGYGLSFESRKGQYTRVTVRFPVMEFPPEV
ncbi:MAG: histidine kinase [Treponema sp.]|nr:histidine kinase [Treponema sp.]